MSANDKYTEFRFPDEQEGEVKQEATQGSQTEEEGVEIVDDTPEADRGRAPLNREIAEPTEEELKEYSEKVQARIKELTHARHDARREKEALARERDELIRTTQHLYEQQKNLQKQLEEKHTYGVTQSEKLAETELAQARAAAARAHEAGDTEAFMEASERMAAARYALERAKEAKNSPLRPAQDSTTVLTEQGERPSVSPQPSQKAMDWRAKNSWFGVDDEMTGYALVLHNKLVKSGVVADSDAYYNALNQRIRQVFPNAFENDRDADTRADTASTRRPATVVAPVNRSTSARKVRLTQTQVAIAKRLGLTPEQYAKEVAKLENSNA